MGFESSPPRFLLFPFSWFLAWFSPAEEVLCFCEPCFGRLAFVVEAGVEVEGDVFETGAEVVVEAGVELELEADVELEGEAGFGVELETVVEVEGDADDEVE